MVQKPDEAIFIAAVKQPDGSAPPEWIKQLRAESFSGKFPMAVGIGLSVEHTTEIHSSYLIAKSTIKAGSAFQRGALHYYPDYMARILLLRSQDTPDLNICFLW